jgi:competence protein ComEC
MYLFDKVPLLGSKKEWLFFLIFILVIFVANVYSEYRQFQTIKESKIHTTKALVVNQYLKSKNSKTYFVLKLKSIDGYSFYTTSREDLKNLKNRYVDISFLTKKLNFFSFIKTFYAISFNIKLLEDKNIRNFFSDYIGNQHLQQNISELFGALYVALPTSPQSKAFYSYYGVSHLVAISGFHLSFLILFITMVLYFLYRPIHYRFFRYRSKVLDISYMGLFILALYLYLINFTPSFIRAYIMYMIAIVFYFKNIKLLSFANLLIAFLLIISFNPRFLFSVGFYFSVMGIFYVYLFLFYFRHLNKYFLYFFLNVWVFTAMLPIVHYYFPIFTPYQFLSIPLSILFPVIYFSTFILHIFNFGGLFDEYIKIIFQFLPPFILYYVSFTLFMLYNIISIIAVFNKLFFIILNICMLVIVSYLLYLYIY